MVDRASSGDPVRHQPEIRRKDTPYHNQAMKDAVSRFIKAYNLGTDGMVCGHHGMYSISVS